MRVWNLSLVATLVGTAALSVTAQPASSEQQRQALELLHQAMSQPNSAPAPANNPASATIGVVPSAPGAGPTAKPGANAPSIGINSAPGLQGVSSANATAPAYRSATSEQQERAIQLLRSTQAGDHLGAPPTATSPQAVNPAKNTSSSASKSANVNKNSSTTANNSTTAPVTASGAAGGTSATSGAPGASIPAPPMQPTGPRTKQQRLSDLLDLYKADKLTPSQYHEQRAKILSEP